MLHSNSIIDEEIVSRMKAMVDFRNIAVRSYQDIDLNILQQIIEKHIEDFADFTQQILRYEQGGFSMKYRIRVFNQNTNKEEISIDEVFESREAAEAAIERLKLSFSQDYQYVKIPVKQ